MCERVVSEDPFFIVHGPDKYKTRRICDEPVDDSLSALKLIPDLLLFTQMKICST